MEAGILLISIGVSHYGELAYNMAKSLKLDQPDLPVALVVDDPKIVLASLSGSQKEVFDQVILARPEHYQFNGTFNPYWLKVNMDEYSPFSHTLYLDVDGIFFNDFKSMDDLFQELSRSDINIQVNDIYAYRANEKIDEAILAEKARGYVWASDVKNIWNNYNLDPELPFVSYNTSLFWFTNSDRNREFFELARHYYHHLTPDFYRIPGGLISDEIPFSLAATKLNHFGNPGKFRPAFMVDRNEEYLSLEATMEAIEGTDEVFREIIKKHYFLMLPGCQNPHIYNFYNYLVARNNQEQPESPAFFINATEKLLFRNLQKEHPHL